MNLVLTGAAGFLGSHILLTWLRDHPTGEVLCLVRSADRASGRERILKAMNSASYESDVAIRPLDLLGRVTTVNADLDTTAWCDSPDLLAWIERNGDFEVIHGAANLSFREEDRHSVWRTNVTGTERFFRGLQGLPGFRNFNYISTAYVAGDREGQIAEALSERPSAFNNVYEESKWFAERTVAELASHAGVGYRIFRPSIIIGHSKTCRISSSTGFYKVVETLVQLGKAMRSRADIVALPIKRNAGLNLIPIDFVVLEMLDVIGVGSDTTGKVFHLTNEHPISLADLFFGVSPLTGVSLERRETGGGDKPLNPMSGLVSRGLRHYMPYFRYSRAFDRSNVWAAGASRHQREYWLDLVRLREFVQAFIAESAHEDDRILQVQP